MSRISLVAAVLALVAALAPSPAPAAGTAWHVELALALDGTPVAAPVLGVRAGEPASVELSQGADGYRIEIRVEPAADAPGQLDLATRLWRRVGAGDWQAAGAPQVRVQPGQAFEVELADGQGRGYRLSGTVAPLPADG